MANANDGNQVDQQVHPYNLHVSSRYLELTKRKLELTRLPRELELPEGQSWKFGTPKSALEPLIDLWQEKYNWRENEAQINKDLPQFRTTIAIPNDSDEKPESLRIHFVHKISTTSPAVPLLYCHSWPGSFLEVGKLVGPLTSPIPTHLAAAEDSPSFHFVAPSIPGLGFSDASSQEEFGLRKTAYVFDLLMKRLGYDKYIVHASQWGFKIARMLALHHPDGCIAIHTSSPPPSPSPSIQTSKPAYFKFTLSHLTRGAIPFLSFGYTRSEAKLPSVQSQKPHFLSTMDRVDSFSKGAFRPQTNAYSLCDSPAGLLAHILDQLYATEHLHLWTPREVLNWTMMLWLPGPEAGLRWLHNAAQEEVFSSYSTVPLGISVYHEAESMIPPDTHNRSLWGILGARKWPALWLEGVQRVTWVRRKRGTAGIPAWDAASDVILDLRDFCASGIKEGWLNLPQRQEVPVGLGIQSEPPPVRDIRTPETAINVAASNTNNIDADIEGMTGEQEQITDGTDPQVAGIRKWLTWRFWNRSSSSNVVRTEQ